MKLAVPVFNQVKAMDLKSFGFGLGVVSILFLLIVFYVYLSASTTLSNIESQLSSITVPVTIATEPIEKVTEHATESKKNKPIIEGLLEKTESGSLPIVREKDGLTSFRAYQQNFDFSKISKPIIVFIVRDFGLSAETSQIALDTLPKEVGFVLSPYSKMPDEWIKRATEKQHEIWMNAPIENDSKEVVDGGRASILLQDQYTNKLKSLHWVLSRGNGYIGIASHTDGYILNKKQDFSTLIDEVYNRGLGYLELNPNANSFIESKALTKDAPYIKADLEILKMTGEKSFETLENYLKTNKVAVAVVPNYPNQIKNLAAWILKIGQIDYTLAPASALYDLALHQNQGSGVKEQTTPITNHDEKHTDTLRNDDLAEPPPAANLNSDAPHH